MNASELLNILKSWPEDAVDNRYVAVYNADRDMCQIIDRIHYHNAAKDPLVLMIKPDDDDTAGDEILWRTLMREIEGLEHDPEVIVWDYDNNINYPTDQNAWFEDDETCFEFLWIQS